LASTARLFGAFDARHLYYDAASERLEDLQRAAGHREPSTTKLYDRRGSNPEKSAIFFATYYWHDFSRLYQELRARKCHE
jgi:hypothetical protein